MKNILDTISSLFSALIYYVKAAVAVLVGNKYLLVGSILLLLTYGRSLKIGNLINYRSK